MDMEQMGVIIAVVGLALTLAAFMRQIRKDATDSAERQARMEGKVDTMGDGIAQINDRLGCMQESMDKHGEQIIRLDERLKPLEKEYEFRRRANAVD